MKADNILVLDVYDEIIEGNKTRIYSVAHNDGGASAERHSEGPSQLIRRRDCEEFADGDPLML